MFKSLMTSRRFAPLFWCQFCSALNDNFLKNALAMLILFGLGGAGGAAGEHGGMLITLSGIVFIAPFFILSALGGELADRYDKAVVAQRIKLAEIPIAGAGRDRLLPALGADPVRGARPVRRRRRAVRPDQVRHPAREAGDGRAAGRQRAGRGRDLPRHPDRHHRRRHRRGRGRAAPRSWSASSWRWPSPRGRSPAPIPTAGPPRPTSPSPRNPWTSTLALLRELKSDRRLWGGAHIVSWFWLVGFVALSLLPALVKTARRRQRGRGDAVPGRVHGRHRRRLGAGGAGQPRPAEPGAGAARRAADGRLRAGARLDRLDAGARSRSRSVPRELLASGTGLALLAACAASPSPAASSSCPSFAAVQAWAPVDRRARVIAAVNVLNAAFMVGAGGIVAVLQAAGVGVPLAVRRARRAQHRRRRARRARLGLGGHARRRPQVFRFFFRLEVKGLENIPGPGERVVIAPNHVSLLDGPMMHAILPSHAAFAVDTRSPRPGG